MINIRTGTFETNSSSTHSICIPKEDRKINIPKEIEIDIKDYEFGWEFKTYNSPDERFAYLIMGLVSGWDDNFLENSVRLDKLLKMIGKYVNSIHIKGLDIVCYEHKTYYDTYDGYVDHANELRELVDALLQNEEMLKRYLFSNDSFILTGNDNDDREVNIDVNYPYDEFCKGN